MDELQVTNTLLQRLFTLDQENASKVLGFILLQGLGEVEMVRLALGPESHLLSFINQAKACFARASNTPSNPIRPNNPFPQPSPRVVIPNNGFHLSNPSSPAVSFPVSSPRPNSYAAVLNGSSVATSSFGDEFVSGQDHLPFLDDSMLDSIMSPSGRSDSVIYPYGEDAKGLPSPHSHPLHRRSCSVNDAAFFPNFDERGGGGGGGFVLRPCMYFKKGFCKNGSACKFFHGDTGDGDTLEVGSAGSNASQFDAFMRMKALQQQRLALMASGGHDPFLHGNSSSSSSRQIYLTFPAESTFREEDVSSYFGTFGPVKDVRIPYQPKRMFGFVTFVYPETVKSILAKGNPHFVCDCRVLVKPYKEKGKVSDKKQLQQLHQQFEMGDYSPSFSLSPSGIDMGELSDLPVGPRMSVNAQEMRLRRKLEQEAELQHAIQLQSRRMSNLQLIDLNNQHHNPPFLLNLPPGVQISSPRQPQLLFSQNLTASDDVTNHDILQDDGQEALESLDVATHDEKLVLEGSESSSYNTLSGNKDQDAIDDDFYLPESLEHNLPDNLFSSPTKVATEHQTVFSHDNSAEADDTESNNYPAPPSSSRLMNSICYSQRKRYYNNS